jgi:hypothetical protein
MGGFHHLDGTPSKSPLWIFIPTAEAITWGSLIAFYEGATFRLPGWLDRALAKVGEWSYSIYLLHFFPIVLMRHLFWERNGSADDFSRRWSWPTSPLSRSCRWRPPRITGSRGASSSTASPICVPRHRRLPRRRTSAACPRART